MLFPEEAFGVKGVIKLTPQANKEKKLYRVITEWKVTDPNTGRNHHFIALIPANLVKEAFIKIIDMELKGFSEAKQEERY